MKSSKMRKLSYHCLVNKHKVKTKIKPASPWVLSQFGCLFLIFRTKN